MSDRERLSGYVDVWWEAVDDFTRLLEELGEDEWSAETDLPGWSVHDVAAHAAHLESLLAGGDHPDVEVGDAPHVRSAMGTFTEQGVLARRGAGTDELINEIRESATARRTELLADPPEDGTAAAPGVFGLIGWNLETLLRNRPLDLWMHEQDVRRAVDRPGHLDSQGARHTVDYLTESLGFVLVKRARAEAGTSVVLEVEGHPPVAYAVSEAGRGERLSELPTAPTACLAMDRTTFAVLAGGRRPEAVADVRVTGDAGLAGRVLAGMAVTP